jgi:hypothetical protein
MVFSLWICFFSIGFSQILKASNNSTTYQLYKYSLILLLISLAITNFIRTQEWSQAWEKESLVLNTMPIESIAKTDNNSKILYLGPSVYGKFSNYYVFMDGWSLNGAIKNKFPQLKQNRDFIPIWPGMTFDIDHAFLNLTDNATWIWDYFKGTVIKVEKPSVIMYDFDSQQYKISPQ